MPPFAVNGSVGQSVIRHHALILQLVRRDIAGRYRGSMLGLVWSLINPLLMLGVYTFVFGVVFQARFGLQGEHTGTFAANLFAGLIVHALFAELITRAPGIVLAHVNYVKKVVFPLEILSWVMLGSALFHLVASFAILLLFLLVTGDFPGATVLLFPLVLVPLVMLLLGLGWLLAGLGVYLRDIGQVTGVVATIALFLSPIFYPSSALPEGFRWVLFLNPLTPIVEGARAVLIEGRQPDWLTLALYTAVAYAVARLGLAWFQRARRGFADVL